MPINTKIIARQENIFLKTNTNTNKRTISITCGAANAVHRIGFFCYNAREFRNDCRQEFKLTTNKY